MDNEKRRIEIEKIHEKIRKCARELGPLYDGIIDLEPYMKDGLILISKTSGKSSHNIIYGPQDLTIQLLAQIIVEMRLPLALLASVIMEYQEMRDKGDIEPKGSFKKKFTPPNSN